MDNDDEELRNDKLLDAIAVFREEQNEVTEHNFIQALIDAVFIAPVNFQNHQLSKTMVMLKYQMMHRCS